MRHILVLVGCGAALSLLAQGNASQVDEAPNTIAKIMIKAHTVKGGRATKQALDQRVVNGEASDEEKTQLAALYQAMTRLKPRKGNLEEWKQGTKALAEAARAAAMGDAKALKHLPELANCKKCHEKFR